MNEENNIYIFKFLMVGNSNVGKTSLVGRLCGNDFDSHYQPTIGVEFVLKRIQMNDSDVQLQIWDTAGQEQFQALGKAYYRDAIGVMLVFSFNDHDSFDSLTNWINDIRTLCHPKAKIMLIGNKIDLVNERRVSKSEVENFAAHHKIEFIETSAKLNTNVVEAFYRVARSILQDVQTREIILGKRDIKLTSQKPVEENKCSC